MQIAYNIFVCVCVCVHAHVCVVLHFPSGFVCVDIQAFKTVSYYSAPVFYVVHSKLQFLVMLS